MCPVGCQLGPCKILDFRRPTMVEADPLRICIEQSFAGRSQPFTVISDSRLRYDSDCDAARFAGRKREELRWEDWSDFSDAVTQFTPDAFLYYLPSLLIISAEQSERWLSAADALMMILDRSPVVDYWDDFFCARFLLLTQIECVAMQKWVISLSVSSLYRQSADRAFDTLALVQERLTPVLQSDQG